MLTSDLGWAGDGAEAAGIQNSLGTNGEGHTVKTLRRARPRGQQTLLPKNQTVFAPQGTDTKQR